MKKIAFILIIVAIMCMLTACGNFQYYDGDYYKVSYALVNIKGEWIEVEVKSWSRTDSNGMVGIVLNDGTVLMTGAENVVIYEGELPQNSDEQRNT